MIVYTYPLLLGPVSKTSLPMVLEEPLQAQLRECKRATRISF